VTLVVSLPAHWQSQQGDPAKIQNYSMHQRSVSLYTDVCEPSNGECTS